LAAFDEGVARLSRIVASAVAPQDRRIDRVRAGLVALLRFLDAEPRWARFLILETAIAGVAVGERRDQALRALAQTIHIETPERRSNSSRAGSLPELTAELIVGGAFCVIRARLLEGSSEPFVALAPSLMSLIEAYQCPEAGPAAPRPDRDWWGGRQSAGERLPVRATYRTTRVLSAIAASPRLSNREIADAAGLSDEGQTSKLLRRLERRGLIENVGPGQAYGGANAWLLTTYGARVLDATRHSLVPGAGAITGRRVRGAA
jgi:hypothetical protein